MVTILSENKWQKQPKNIISLDNVDKSLQDSYYALKNAQYQLNHINNGDNNIVGSEISKLNREVNKLLKTTYKTVYATKALCSRVNVVREQQKINKLIDNSQRLNSSPIERNKKVAATIGNNSQLKKTI